MILHILLSKYPFKSMKIRCPDSRNYRHFQTVQSFVDHLCCDSLSSAIYSEFSQWSYVTVALHQSDTVAKVCYSADRKHKYCKLFIFSLNCLAATILDDTPITARSPRC